MQRLPYIELNCVFELKFGVTDPMEDAIEKFRPQSLLKPEYGDLTKFNFFNPAFDLGITTG